jgi:hypothetical protein
MKAYRGVDIQTHVFLTSALVGSGTHWIGDWVNRTAGLNDMEK